MAAIHHHASRRGRQSGDLFEGPTIDVARRLVGMHLERVLPQSEPDGGRTLVGRIVETEAYLPLVDPSCHGYRGPTKRNASMFGRAGFAYVYFIYGNHYCLNVTTERPGIGGAVLIRAAEPLAEIDAMRRRRPGVQDAALLSGPGNLCRAMSINRGCDGVDLRRGALRITAPAKNAVRPLAVSPRIGLKVAAKWPLRFYEPASPSVSPFRRRLRNGVGHADSQYVAPAHPQLRL